MTYPTSASSRLPRELAARVLRAKIGEIEASVADLDDLDDVDYLRLDVALIAGVLATLLEDLEAPFGLTPRYLPTRPDALREADA